MLRTTLIAWVLLLLAGPAFAQTEPKGARIEVNGMQMYYEVSGAGEPLVVLHGAYMNIPSMGRIISKLAETHKIERRPYTVRVFSEEEARERGLILDGEVDSVNGSSEDK